MIVSSSGGVLLDVMALECWWKLHSTTWVSVKAADTEVLLSGRKVHWVKECVASKPWELAIGLFKALEIIVKEKPQLILSAGTGIAIGFFVVARLKRIPTFWIDTFNMINTVGLTSRICGASASEVLIQRQSLLKQWPNAVCVGELI